MVSEDITGPTVKLIIIAYRLSRNLLINIEIFLIYNYYSVETLLSAIGVMMTLKNYAYRLKNRIYIVYNKKYDIHIQGYEKSYIILT